MFLKNKKLFASSLAFLCGYNIIKYQINVTIKLGAQENLL